MESSARAESHAHHSSTSSAQAWWDTHFIGAADQVLAYFAADGISLEGKRVADVGCGDGMIDLGIALRGKPAELVGFDIKPTPIDDLRRRAKEFAGVDDLPPNLRFVTSSERHIPAEDDSFDTVVSWSAFEHIADPAEVLKEIRRILRPDGHLFIQVWPFYDSEHGSHLVDWFPEGFVQHRYTLDEVRERLLSQKTDVSELMLEAYQTLNKIGADDLHAALREAGFLTAKLSLQTEALHVPPEAAHVPFSRIGVSGIQLIAIKDHTFGTGEPPRDWSTEILDAPPSVTDHYSTSAAPDVWWQAHFHDAADEVIDFFSADGVSLEGKRIADIGCGDGILDLGVAVKGKPSRLIGLDIFPTDVEQLRTIAREQGGIEQLPPALRFGLCGQTTIPAEDESFDVVMSWSAFEHIADPVGMLREIRRVLRPLGHLFIQVWPFYETAHGPHLVDWFPEGFAQHRLSDDEIRRAVRRGPNQELASEMLEVFRTLNRISADDLHAALRQAGFQVAKLVVQSEGAHLPPFVQDVPFSRIALSGVKLIAIKDNSWTDPTETPEPTDGAGAAVTPE